MKKRLMAIIVLVIWLFTLTGCAECSCLSSQCCGRGKDAEENTDLEDNDESEMSIWEEKICLDEFDLPTEETYVINRKPFVGKYSNVDVTDAPLKAYLIKRDETISIQLIENRSHIVKNNSTNDRDYEVKVLSSSGDIYEIEGAMAKGGDMIDIDKQDIELVVGALMESGSVRFAIKRNDAPATKYLFTIEDSSGFSEFFPFEIGRYLEAYNGYAMVYKN